MKRKDLVFFLTYLMICALVIVVFFFIDRPQVKGSQIARDNVIGPGFSLLINTKVANWVLFEYMCDSHDQCVLYDSLEGEAVFDHKIILTTVAEWQNYTYLKLYVLEKTLDEVQNNSFDIVSVGNVPGSQVMRENDLNVFVLPIKPVLTSFYQSATFNR